MKMKGKAGGFEYAVGGALLTLGIFVFAMYSTGNLSVTGQVPAAGEGKVPEVPGYTPFEVAHAYGYTYDAMDTKTTFGGADDVQCRVWAAGAFDFLGPYIDTDSQSSTGQVDFAASRLKTATSYDVLCYENDGGTPVYAKKFDITLGQLSPEKTSWSYDKNIELYKEGAFDESACDSATAAFDEAADTVTLNKTASTVQGVLSWDCVIGQTTAGAVLKDPVIIFRESPTTPMTDINDIEAIWVSVKTGSGVTLPSNNLVSEFKAGAPVAMTSDGVLGSADSATMTVKIQLPSAEANVGTGNFQMIYDDLGDYRAKDLDFDVRAADETTTFVINA
jgi:hypothetical protein